MKKLILYLLTLVVFSSAALACQVTLSATDTDSLIKEIPAINKQLATCNLNLPSSVNWLLDGETVELATSKSIFFSYTNGSLQLAATHSSPDYTATLKECELISALSSQNIMGAAATLYTQNKVSIKANTFLKKASLLVLKPFVNGFAKKAATPVTNKC